MNKILSWFAPKIGVPYRFDNDFGGKFMDGTFRAPLKYIPTEIKHGRVFYDVVSPDVGFVNGDSASILEFWACYKRYE